MNYSTQTSLKHGQRQDGQGQDLTQPPSSITVTKTGMDKDYTYVMLILITSEEVSSCNFAGTSLKEKRNRKLFIKLINCQVICYTSLLFELQVGHFNSSFFLATSIILTEVDLACNQNIMLAISEATSVSPRKCPRKWISCKCLLSHFSNILCSHSLIFVIEFRHTKKYIIF